jgi:hypothetical protein
MDCCTHARGAPVAALESSNDRKRVEEELHDGEPAASLAHEIKQPLAAAVTHESLRQLEAILAHINRVSEC